MKKLVLLMLLSLPLTAKANPPGLISADLMAGWVDDDGNRVSALKITLEDGWKTYWRNPGDAGIPPQIEWQSGNIGKVTMHWPAPEVIVSDGVRTLGFHDQLVLPFTVQPKDPARPVALAGEVTFGLCEDVCVPAALTLTAPPPAAKPDPLIRQAMARQPKPSDIRPACEISEIEDGMSVTMTLPHPGASLAIEHAAGNQIWVSAPVLSKNGAEARADFVNGDAKPFALSGDDVIITEISKDGATEYHGCAS